MFTGIIEAVGRIAAVTRAARGLRVAIDTGPLDLGDVRLGDSIAVQGVCLTVVELTGGGFAVDVSEETLRCTTLGECGAGGRVNLEKALCPGGRLGGHFVTGHVDGIGTVAAAQRGDPDAGMRVAVPEALVRYLARKGSVCVDGASLTVNRIEGREFEVHLIPHTLSATIAGSYRAGTRVNIEVDLLARYVESFLAASKTHANSL
ncbi:MAG: riboflavin synthase [Pseudomonadota bacterium]|nr:riboflavin synthase [Pseudomonadota bacterium]